MNQSQVSLDHRSNLSTERFENLFKHSTSHAPLALAGG
jgi:hypothetical protein